MGWNPVLAYGRRSGLAKNTTTIDPEKDFQLL